MFIGDAQWSDKMAIDMTHIHGAVRENMLVIPTSYVTSAYFLG